MDRVSRTLPRSTGHVRSSSYVAQSYDLPQRGFSGYYGEDGRGSVDDVNNFADIPFPRLTTARSGELIETGSNLRRDHSTLERIKKGNYDTGGFDHSRSSTLERKTNYKPTCVKLDEKSNRQFIGYPVNQSRVGGNRYSESSNDTDDALLSNWQEPFRKFDFDGNSPANTNSNFSTSTSSRAHEVRKEDIRPPAYHDMGKTWTSNGPGSKAPMTKQNGSHSVESQMGAPDFPRARGGGLRGEMSSHRGYSSDSEDSQSWLERQRSKLQTSRVSRQNRTAQERQLVAELRNSQANLAAQKASFNRDWENLDSNNNYSGFATTGRSGIRGAPHKYGTLDNKRQGENRSENVQRSFSFTTHNGPSTKYQTLPRNHRLDEEDHGTGRLHGKSFDVEVRTKQSSHQPVGYSGSQHLEAFSRPTRRAHSAVAVNDDVSFYKDYNPRLSRSRSRDLRGPDDTTITLKPITVQHLETAERSATLGRPPRSASMSMKRDRSLSPNSMYDLRHRTSTMSRPSRGSQRFEEKSYNVKPEAYTAKPGSYTAQPEPFIKTFSGTGSTLERRSGSLSRKQQPVYSSSTSSQNQWNDGHYPQTEIVSEYAVPLRSNRPKVQNEIPAIIVEPETPLVRETDRKFSSSLQRNASGTGKVDWISLEKQRRQQNFEENPQQRQQQLQQYLQQEKLQQQLLQQQQQQQQARAGQSAQLHPSQNTGTLPTTLRTGQVGPNIAISGQYLQPSPEIFRPTAINPVEANTLSPDVQGRYSHRNGTMLLTGASINDTNQATNDDDFIVEQALPPNGSFQNQFQRGPDVQDGSKIQQGNVSKVVQAPQQIPSSPNVARRTYAQNPDMTHFDADNARVQAVRQAEEDWMARTNQRSNPPRQNVTPETIRNSNHVTLPGNSYVQTNEFYSTQNNGPMLQQSFQNIPISRSVDSSRRSPAPMMQTRYSDQTRYDPNFQPLMDEFAAFNDSMRPRNMHQTRQEVHTTQYSHSSGPYGQQTQFSDDQNFPQIQFQTRGYSMQPSMAFESSTVNSETNGEAQQPVVITYAQQPQKAVRAVLSEQYFQRQPQEVGGERFIGGTQPQWQGGISDYQEPVSSKPVIGSPPVSDVRAGANIRSNSFTHTINRSPVQTNTNNSLNGSFQNTNNNQISRSSGTPNRPSYNDYNAGQIVPQVNEYYSQSRGVANTGSRNDQPNVSEQRRVMVTQSSLDAVDGSASGNTERTPSTLKLYTACGIDKVVNAVSAQMAKAPLLGVECGQSSSAFKPPMPNQVQNRIATSDENLAITPESYWIQQQISSPVRSQNQLSGAIVQTQRFEETCYDHSSVANNNRQNQNQSGMTGYGPQTRNGGVEYSRFTNPLENSMEKSSTPLYGQQRIVQMGSSSNDTLDVASPRIPMSISSVGSNQSPHSVELDSRYRGYGVIGSPNTAQSSPSVSVDRSSGGSISSSREGADSNQQGPYSVKFIRDTSSNWYKPQEPRDRVVSALRSARPGTFIVRDSTSFPGSYALAVKVAEVPVNVQSSTTKGDRPEDLIRHFLIEPTPMGVRLKGYKAEPIFGSLAALVYQHTITPISLPCKLILPGYDADGNNAMMTGVSNLLPMQLGPVYTVLYITSVDTETLTGPEAIERTASRSLRLTSPQTTVTQLSVTSEGVTLTDNKRKLFFRRHYPLRSITYCGLDQKQRCWKVEQNEISRQPSNGRLFGFVSRKPNNNGNNECHLFAELDADSRSEKSTATVIIQMLERYLSNENK